MSSGNELVEACAIPVTADGAPLTLTCFDPSEELVWSASGSGMIYSHMVPSMELYSAFHADQARGSPAIGLFPNPFGLCLLTHDAVRFYSKGGCPLGNVVRDELAGASCGCLMPSASAAQLAVCAYGTTRPALSILDLTTAQVTASLELETPATLARLCRPLNLLCLAGSDGTVSTYDVRAGGARPAGKCALFTGRNQVVCAIDVADSSLVASAVRSRLGPMGGQEVHMLFTPRHASSCLSNTPPLKDTRTQGGTDTHRAHTRSAHPHTPRRTQGTATLRTHTRPQDTHTHLRTSRHPGSSTRRASDRRRVRAPACGHI